MKTTKYALVLALGSVALLVPKTACADTSATFDLTGTFKVGASNQTGNFSAAITIDTTTGVATSFSVTDPAGTFGGTPNAVNVFQPDSAGGFSLDVQDSSGDFLGFSVLQSSLVGVTNLTVNPSAFAGGLDAFGDGTLSSDPCNGFTCFMTSLSITPAATVPEPSSLLLLGAGLFGMLGALRRKLIS